MLRCEFHPGLVEQAAFLAARRDPTTERALRAELEQVYCIADPHQRDDHFARIHGRWFVALRLDRLVQSPLAQQPVIAREVQRCHVREAAGRRRENVELFVRCGANNGTECARTLIIDLCPESLLEADRLGEWLRRELFKVADMLDERFGYSPALPAVHHARQDLVRDRYRVLWDIYVEARLRCSSASYACFAESPARLCARFERAFVRGDARASAGCVDALLRVTSTTHGCLLGWALQPETIPSWTATGGHSAHRAGELCPLCCFPTYDWYDFDRDADAEIQLIISQAQPAWRSAQGACRQCVETYAGQVCAESAFESHRA